MLSRFSFFPTTIFHIKTGHSPDSPAWLAAQPESSRQTALEFSPRSPRIFSFSGTLTFHIRRNYFFPRRLYIVHNMVHNHVEKLFTTFQKPAFMPTFGLVKGLLCINHVL